jgi:hypothetical protein
VKISARLLPFLSFRGAFIAALKSLVNPAMKLSNYLSVRDNRLLDIVGPRFPDPR